MNPQQQTPEEFLGLFSLPPHPTCADVSQGSSVPPQNTKKIQRSLLGRAGPWSRGMHQESKQFLRIFLLAAPSSGLGGVAGSRTRSGRSWSCSHNLLLLFRASFFPKLARVPVAALVLCQLPSWAALSQCLPMESELSVPLPMVRLKQLPTESCWKGRGIHPPLLPSRGFTLTRSAPGRSVIIYFQHLQRSVRTRQCRIQ